MSDPDRIAADTVLFATIFEKSWENVRGIKSERIGFMNTYSVISAGSLSGLPRLLWTFRGRGLRQFRTPLG
jgi:hypothetical protein